MFGSFLGLVMPVWPYPKSPAKLANFFRGGGGVAGKG